MKIRVTCSVRKFAGAIAKVRWSSAAFSDLGIYIQNVDFCLMHWPLWDSTL